MLTYDSRAVKEGGCFVAVSGLWVDGHDYIDKAIDAGARLIIAQTPRTDTTPSAVTWAQVADSELALGTAASAFYGEPSKAMNVYAVTGTNGKTTVTWFLYQMLKTLGREPGLVGTVEQRFGDIRRKTIFTTPPSADLQALLGEMRDYGCSDATIEASSHGLAMNRLSGITVAIAGFTNLSRDHLDYHETMDAYFDAKARLFREFAPKAAINVDDPAGKRLADEFNGECITVSAQGNDADLSAKSSRPSLAGSHLTLDAFGVERSVFLPVTGRHNVENALVGVGMAVLAGHAVEDVLQSLSDVEAPAGRLQRIEGPKAVFVDYAHTPDALANVLRALRPVTPERLLCVFGAGGDRDPGKRPKMGAAADSGADVVIVTSDNPRTEDPDKIIEDVVSGISEDAVLHVDSDRRSAIRWAISQAKPQDVVLIAGKGHEDYQIIGTQKRHFDDAEEAFIAMNNAS